MRRIKQLLTMQRREASTRAIGRELGIAPSTVREYLGRATAAGIGWPLAADVTDESLVARLFVNAGVRAGARFHAEPDWPALVREIKRPGECPEVVGSDRRRYDRSGDVDLGDVNALGIAIDRDGHAQRGGWRRRNGDQPARWGQQHSRSGADAVRGEAAFGVRAANDCRRASGRPRGPAARRPENSSCSGRCHVNSRRCHLLATPFGKVKAQLPRFRCVSCGHSER